MSERKDWSVPWPDGSWLTWNEATELWEKQDEPAVTPAPKADEPDQDEPTVTPGDAADEPDQDDAATTERPVTSREPASTPAPEGSTSRTKPRDVSTEHRWSWQPLSDASKPSTAASKPSTAASKPSTVAGTASSPPAMRTAPTPSVARTSSKPSIARSVGSSSGPSVGARPAPLWSVIAAGAAVGVAAGYLLMNLFR